MTEEQTSFLRRADEKLRAARYLLKGAFLDDAVSRAYYAMFYAAEAVILTQSDVPKTHSGVLTQFSKLFVKTGELDVEMGRQLRKSMDIRQLATYRGDALSRKEADHFVSEADTFVQKINAYLKRQRD